VRPSPGGAIYKRRNAVETPQSIIEEINDLWSKGYKEITLFRQNVDSYLWYGGLKRILIKLQNFKKATAVNSRPIKQHNQKNEFIF
jgi:tRNA-2-methylthio-N6-dimethylallyladenosine synthase